MFSRLEEKEYFVGILMNSENATVTLATGMDFCNKPEFWVYVDSLKNVEADNYVLTYEMNINHRRRLEKQGCQVIDVDRYFCDYGDPSSNFFIARNMAYYGFLRSLMNYKKVAITDSKDIIFQKNIFEVFPEDKILMTTEGIPHKESPWNLMDQFNFHKSVNEKYKPDIVATDLSEKLVINGGIILGKPRDVYLALSPYCSMESYCNDTSKFTDQAIWNHFVYHWIMELYKNDLKFHLSNPKIDNICITGETIKLGLIDYKFENNKFLTNDGKEYYISHQWDRTIHKDQLLND